MPPHYCAAFPAHKTLTGLCKRNRLTAMPQPDARVSRNSPRLLLTLLVWLLLGLQALTPLVHAHIQDAGTHRDSHLLELQQAQSDVSGWVNAHFSQDHGMAVGMAQGMPRQPPRGIAELPPAALVSVPLWSLAPTVLTDAAWAQAPPTVLTLALHFFSPPAQAPPPVLL